MTVWFDVEDLFHYAGSGLTRTSGIQRVGLEIYRAAVELGASVGFVRHAPGTELFQVVGWEAIQLVFAGQAGAAQSGAGQSGAGTVAAQQRRAGRTWLGGVPEEIRAPLVGAVESQWGALVELRRLGAAAAGAPGRAVGRAVRRRPRTVGVRFGDVAGAGDTLLVLGSPWQRPYSPAARVLRGERRMRFGVLVHDLIPVRHPEWVDIGTRRVFEPWYADVLPHCDMVFANSRHTADDVEEFRRERGLKRGRAVDVLPMGTGFGGGNEGEGLGGEYVLVVGTMEARKNHALAVRVWARLLAEERAGQRAKGSVPDLVFAGRVGWLVADLVAQLERTEWLGERVRLVEAPTDSALRGLYRGSLFTLFPSFSEGWGLPVSESLALGKACVCSDAAALPEAGGRFCRYFDPDDLEGAYRAVVSVLDDRAGLAAWEAEIGREYRAVGWGETVGRLLEVVGAL